MQTWDDLRVLLALHRHKSFLSAAKALGVSTSTVARRIEALEGSLGRSLVHRSSAGTSIEPDALELVSLAEQLELGLHALSREGSEEAVSGTVRVSMGDGFVLPVTQGLVSLRTKHPELALEIISETRVADLARREADIGIRKVRSQSPVLIERPAGRLRFAFYASPSYIERRLRGGLLRSDDLKRHDFVGFDRSLSSSPQAKWLTEQGATRFVFRSNSDHALQAAAEQGQGVVLMAEAQARSTAALVRLDTDLTLPAVTIFIAYHKELRRVPRVRVVVNALDAFSRQALA